MKDIQHILRMLAVFLLSIVGYFGIRSFIVPSSYGHLGRYRADSVEENKALPISFAGRAGEKACAKCHKPQAAAKVSGKHQTLGCETCHGPLAAHVVSPKTVKPVKPQEAEVVAFCLRCHAQNISKPKEFPTVDPRLHNPDNACTMCHQPHSPGL